MHAYKFSQIQHVIILCITAVDCGELRSPASGSVTLIVGTTFESTAAYICNDGFILIGNLRRTCQANGQWSGSEPACSSGMHSFDYIIIQIWV